jgi:hypothetical protein
MGTRLKLKDGNFTVDGPYAETKEVIDGFALIEVKSVEEAIEVARRFMTSRGTVRVKCSRSSTAAAASKGDLGSSSPTCSNGTG